MMAHVVPAELHDLRVVEQLLPRGVHVVEARVVFAFEHAAVAEVALRAPAFERLIGFRVERDVPRLAQLRRLRRHSGDPSVEIT